jgi:hypothetical protein
LKAAAYGCVSLMIFKQNASADAAVASVNWLTCGSKPMHTLVS